MGSRITVDRRTGLVTDVRQVLSPHFDARPSGIEPDLLVVHGISLPPNEFGGAWIEQFFCGNLRADAHPFFREIERLKVSAHLLIRRDGALVQFVSLLDRAWHAGVSSFLGRESCNDFSIGVELEGADDVPYDDRQYRALAELTRTLMDAYPVLTAARVVGHADIAPGRKTDPGPAFDWPRLRAALRS